MNTLDPEFSEQGAVVTVPIMAIWPGLAPVAVYVIGLGYRVAEGVGTFRRQGLGETQRVTGDVLQEGLRTPLLPVLLSGS